MRTIRILSIIGTVCLTMGFVLASDIANEVKHFRQDIEYLRDRINNDGDMDAAYSLGMLFTRGYASGIKFIDGGGVQPRPATFEMGVESLRRAAERNHVQSMYMLGRILTRVHPPDFDEAAKWFRKAADLGHARAQCEYAGLCGRGLAPEVGGLDHPWFKQPIHKITEPPPPEWKQTAITWYDRAAQQNLYKAKLALQVEDREAERKWEREKPIGILQKRWNGKDCHLIYINGIFTEKERFDATLLLLRRLLDIDGFGEHFTVCGVFAEGEPDFISTIKSVTSQKFGNADPGDIHVNLLREVRRGLDADRQVVLLGHSRGNLHIHDLLTLHPELADQVRVIALGSPTYDIPAENVVYLRERRDPVAVFGAITEAGGRIPGDILDAIKDSATALKALGLLNGKVEPVRFTERPGVVRDSFSNPLLYINLGDPSSRNTKEGLSTLLAFTAKTPQGVVAKLIGNEALRLILSGKAHDVILSYLLGPGLQKLLHYLHQAVGVSETRKSLIPPPKRENYFRPTPPVPAGAGIVGRWRRFVNGNYAGVYSVWRAEDGGYGMARTEFASGAWPPARSIDNITLQGDEWSFTADWGFSRMPFKLIRQTEDIYAGVVQGNENRWVRDDEAPTVNLVQGLQSPEKADPELPLLMEGLDSIAAIPLGTSEPPALEPLDMAILSDSPAAGGASTQPDSSPGDTAASAVTTRTGSRSNVVAVNPRGLVGTWTRYVGENPTFDIGVEYDAKKKAVSMKTVFTHPDVEDELDAMTKVLYTGNEWSFDCLFNGTEKRIYLHRLDRDTYETKDAVENWRRK